MSKKRVVSPQAPEARAPSRAPAKSIQHLQLRAVARKAGQDEETLRDIFWLINAHDQLIGLREVAHNLLTILRPLEEYSFAGRWRDEMELFSGWESVLEWVVERYSKEASGRERNPISRHGIIRHPFYAALWQRQGNQRWRERYAGLQLHLLWAHASYLYRESKANGESSICSRSEYEAWDQEEMWPAFPNSPYDATRHVRALAEPGWGQLLGMLPVSKSPHKFLLELANIACPKAVPEGLRATWPQKRAQLGLFLAKANDKASWIRREGNTGPRQAATSARTGGWSRSIDMVPGDPDDPDGCWLDGRLVLYWQMSEEEQKKYLESDLDPEEAADPDALYLVAEGSFDRQNEAIRSALAARGQYRHVQLANQLLPWEYSQLTLQELAWLLRHASKTWRDFPEPALRNEGHWFTAELVALTHVMVWTGSSLERAWDLKVLDEDDRGEYRRKQVLESNLLFELDTRQWRIHAEGPEYRSEIPDPERQAYPRELSFLLPDVARTGTFLRSLKRRSSKSPGPYDPASKLPAASSEDLKDGATRRTRSEEGFLFTADLETYRSGLKKWLKEERYDLTGRLTIGRLSSFLFHRLTAVTGDVTAAAVLTGQNHQLAQTQQFYSTWSVSHLREVYLAATGTIVEQTCAAANPPPPPRLTNSPSAAESYVGARLCARPDAVQEAVRHLQENLARSGALTDRTGSIAHHNLYTLYTVLLFGYSTSMRAIRTPYLHLDRVDKATGFAFLSDKDDEAERKTRLAWVPPFVIEQMRNYADHLAALASDNPRIPVDYPLACYFLDEKEEPLKVSPLTLSLHMKPYLSLPPNAHRRCMRQQLQRGGCPPEVISAWLGHASLGEEPAGSYSTFSFSEYRLTLERYLLPILEALGWKPIQSPLY